MAMPSQRSLRPATATAAALPPRWRTIGAAAKRATDCSFVAFGSHAGSMSSQQRHRLPGIGSSYFRIQTNCVAIVAGGVGLASFRGRHAASARKPWSCRIALAAEGTAVVATEAPASRSKRPTLQLQRNQDGLSGLTLTTPLFYANGSPHIGSAYPAIASDVMARYAKLRGASVHFVTGMDEHGEKIAQTAAGQNKSPQQLVDGYAAEFQDLWNLLAVVPDHFARTTQERHKAIVTEMWQRCLAKGDIYKKDYTGWYCVGCEAYLDDDEMLEGDGHVCATHRKPCVLRSEENYFFRLSKYWDDVKRHVVQNSDFILPVSRQSQILVWLEDDNKRDFSISRASTNWGIPVPGDDSQVIYVWFDALLGYLSSLLHPEDPPSLDAALSRGWPADLHIIGKDIMRFHAIYWPAMLMSADLPLPRHICTHGFLTKDGLKMGKSLGNVVEPVPLVKSFGADAVRYFFSSCIGFGEDGDFSYEVFIKRVNSGLANELGNLVHRLLTLCRKNLQEPTSALDLTDSEHEPLEAHPVRQETLKAVEVAATCYESLDFPKATAAALSIATAANVRMNEIVPWTKLKGSEADKREALREMLVMSEGVRICAVLLSPVTPELSGKILKEFLGDSAEATTWKQTDWRWDALPGLVQGSKPSPLFPRIDIEPWKGM